MQTEKIIPLHRASEVLNLEPEAAPAEWMYIGKIIPITPEINMGIAYDQVDGEYVPRFKFWHGRNRIKDLHLNDNNQLDLRTSCRTIITMLATQFTPRTQKPLRTLIEIATVPYSWEV